MRISRVNLKGTQISWWQDWSQWLSRKGWNWRDFTFIELSVEDDIIFGNFEVTAGILGFGLRLVINFTAPSKKGKRIIKTVEKIHRHLPTPPTDL